MSCWLDSVFDRFDTDVTGFLGPQQRKASLKDPEAKRRRGVELSEDALGYLEAEIGAPWAGAIWRQDCLASCKRRTFDFASGSPPLQALLGLVN